METEVWIGIRILDGGTYGRIGHHRYSCPSGSAPARACRFEGERDGGKAHAQGGSYYVLYANGPDGNTEVADEVPYGENITINLWVNGDNIGQVRDNGGTLSRYYYLKDHLGDIKMILNSSGGVDSYNDFYPFGEQMPGRNGAGSADGRYKYISIEQDAETGLYATGARVYDPWSGRFGVTDPLADFYPSESPYSYSLENPERFLDPSGLDPQNQNNDQNWNWQFGMNGTIVVFDNSGKQYNLPPMYEHEGRFLDVKGAEDVSGKLEYIKAQWMTLSWGSMWVAGAGFGGGQAPSAPNGGSATQGRGASNSWATGVAAVGTSFDSQLAILKYGNALEAAGDYGKALEILSKSAGYASAAISFAELVQHRNLGNLGRFLIDFTFAACVTDPPVLLTKGILDATGASSSFYRGVSQLGTYFTTYGYTYDPKQQQ